MKRTALTRRTPLKRGKPIRRSGALKRGAGLKPGKPLARKTRLRPVNPERKLERYARNYGDRGAIVRAMPCLLLAAGGCKGAVEAAHVKSRGAGGDRRSLIPLCMGHHNEQHQHGAKTFAAKYEVDLGAAAARIAVDLDLRGVP
jgi:hypothetical protein